MIHKLSRNRKGARTTVAASQREGAPEGSTTPPLPSTGSSFCSLLIPHLPLRPRSFYFAQPFTPLPNRITLRAEVSRIEIAMSHFYQISLIKPSVRWNLFDFLSRTFTLAIIFRDNELKMIERNLSLISTAASMFTLIGLSDEATTS